MRKHWCILSVLVVLATAASAFMAKVVVVNNSSWDIYEFYLSSVDDDEWGPDQLGEHVIESGGEFTLSRIPCDSYDVQLVDEDGFQCVLSDVDICGGRDRWVITDRLLEACTEESTSSTLEIVNRSDWDIYELYLSPADSREWGPDQLARNVLSSGDRYTLSDIPCDTYDVRLVDEDDDECILEEIDICADEHTWVFDNKTLLKCQGFSR